MAALLIEVAPGADAAEPIVAGANIGNVPWEFQDADGGFVGFELDLVREVGKRLGREVEVVNIPFNGLFSAVQSGRIDIALSSITITDKRLRSVSFAQPYYDSAQSLTVLEQSGNAGLADMRGKVVGVDTGSTGDMWTSANQASYGFGEIRRYEGLAPAMLDLQSMRIDGYISDIPALEYYIKDKRGFRIAERIETGESYSMMFARDNPLVDAVDAVIAELKRESYLAGLHQKWFGSVPAPGSATVLVKPLPRAPQ
ncbi:MAG: ABC transporter substrate-binding protein [Gammaproteobacteria bacterium]|nr:ABC transporter substrate-binding protein [Gammaproteobacteria bacterium]MDH4254694.1 ABC transporter substrate-binding protein [Gammaproteobacteria bacterium]MDH5308797.1 ABC transporter substrate-binding protein [Gammaproteobacteria bacterium]